MRRMTIGALLVLVAVLVGISGGNSPERPLLRFTWNQPTTGTPVQIYQLQVRDVDGGLDTVMVVPAKPEVNQEHSIYGEYMRRYVARVRGVDAQGRSGAWTAYTPHFVAEAPEP